MTGAGRFIQVPRPEAYFEPINWHRTALHELAHASGHASRLNRDPSGSFGSRKYAYAEIVAEISSAFMCASLGIVPTVRHADYIGSWLEPPAPHRRRLTISWHFARAPRNPSKPRALPITSLKATGGLYAPDKPPKCRLRGAAVLTSEGGRLRRDGSQATEGFYGIRHGGTTMRKTDYPTSRDYDDYVASALGTEGGHLSIGRGGFTLYYAHGARVRLRAGESLLHRRRLAGHRQPAGRL